MKTYELKQNLVQHYIQYTNEDFFVWKTLFERQGAILNKLAASEFQLSLNEIGFTSDKIPDFRQIDEILMKKTGWRLMVVEGIINEKDFFELLANKKFPATTWLRKPEQLDYLPEPDMFHDVFGHVPLLTNIKFCKFFEEIGKLGCENADSPEILNMLGRIYWFTIEFGLIRENNELKIYGAGIISSHKESKFSVSDEPLHSDFDVIKIMNMPFDNDKIQNQYFVLHSFDELYNSLELITKLIKVNAKKMHEVNKL